MSQPNPWGNQSSWDNNQGNQQPSWGAQPSPQQNQGGWGGLPPQQPQPPTSNSEPNKGKKRKFGRKEKGKSQESTNTPPRQHQQGGFGQSQQGFPQHSGFSQQLPFGQQGGYPLQSQQPPEELKPKRKMGKKVKWGLIACGLVAASVGGYLVYATPVSEIEAHNTGSADMNAYLSCLNEYDRDCILERFPESYIGKEHDYLNGNNVRTSFVRSVLMTPQFQVNESQKLNWFNRPATNYKREPIFGPATLNLPEDTAVFSYIDYSQIPLDKEILVDVLEKQELTDPKDVEYKRKVTNVFAHYIYTYLQQNDPPLKQVERRPFLNCEGEGKDSICKVSQEEDTFWDDTLFGSQDFMLYQDKFAEFVAAHFEVTPIKGEVPKPKEEDEVDSTPQEESTIEANNNPVSWSDQVQFHTVQNEIPGGQQQLPLPPSPQVEQQQLPIFPAQPQEPSVPIDTQTPSTSTTNPVQGGENVATVQGDESNPAGLEGTLNSQKPAEELTPDAFEEQRIEARKYEERFYLEDAWIGANRLMSETDEEGNPISTNFPRVGDGTLEAPAGVGTPVVTFQYGAKGVHRPLEVTLTKFLTGQDAINTMERKSQMNRGFILESDVQYAYYEFTIKNLSDIPLDIKRNDTLTDPQRNHTARTGTVYGLVTHVNQVPPGEEITLESWTSSTNLDELYLVWGENFNPKDEPAWFRVLAGDSSNNPDKVIESSEDNSEELDSPESDVPESSAVNNELDSLLNETNGDA